MLFAGAVIARARDNGEQLKKKSGSAELSIAAAAIARNTSISTAPATRSSWSSSAPKKRLGPILEASTEKTMTLAGHRNDDLPRGRCPALGNVDLDDGALEISNAAENSGTRGAQRAASLSFLGR